MFKSPASTKTPVFVRLRSSKVFVTFVVSYAVFSDQFIFAVIVPVMPFTLHNQVGVAEASVQYWVSVLLAIFGAATTIASPIWGWYTDRTLSRRGPFLSGLFVILGATVMIWLGPNIALQIIGRSLQGAASAIVWVTGLALMADTVDRRELGYYAGCLGIAMMVGKLIAPLLGGIVLAKAGYNAVFEMTLAAIGIDIVLRFLIIEKTKLNREQPEITDGNVLGLHCRQHTQDSLPTTTTDTASSEVHPATPESTESRSKNPLPAILTLLISRRLLVALWASLIVAAIYAGLEAVLPLQTQTAFGWTSIGAGLIFLPLTILAFFGLLVGWFCDRYGARVPVLIGFILLCPFLTLLRLVDHNSINQKVLLSALLTLIGCCFTLTFNPLIAEVAAIVEGKSRAESGGGVVKATAYAQAFELFNMACSIGDTGGPICAGLVCDAAGWGTMGWVLGLLCGVTAIPAGLWCGGWIGGRSIGGGWIGKGWIRKRRSSVNVRMATDAREGV